MPNFVSLGDRIYQDRFNRSDREIVGRGWVERNETLISDPAFTGSSALRIFNGALQMEITTGGLTPSVSPVALQPYASRALPEVLGDDGFTLSFSVTADTGERLYHFAGLNQSSAGEGVLDMNPNTLIPLSGIGIILIRSDSTSANSQFMIVRYDGDTNFNYNDPNSSEIIGSGFTSFQFEAGQPVDVQLSFEADGEWSVSLSDGASSDVFSGRTSPLDDIYDEIVFAGVEAGVPFNGDGTEVVTFDDISVDNGPTVDRIYLDRFNRTDREIVGRGWVEQNETSLSDPAFTGSSALRIVNGALQMEITSGGLTPPVGPVSLQPYASHSLPEVLGNDGFTLSYSVTADTGERLFHFAGLNQSSAGEATLDMNPNTLIPLSGIGIIMIRSSSSFANSQFMIVRYDGDTNFNYNDPNSSEIIGSGFTSFQFEAGQAVDVQLSFEADGEWAVSLSNGTSTDVFSGTTSPLDDIYDEIVFAGVEAGVPFDGDGTEIVTFDDIAVYSEGIVGYIL